MSRIRIAVLIVVVIFTPIIYVGLAYGVLGSNIDSVIGVSRIHRQIASEAVGFDYGGLNLKLGVPPLVLFSSKSSFSGGQATVWYAVQPLGSGFGIRAWCVSTSEGDFEEAGDVSILSNSCN